MANILVAGTDLDKERRVGGRVTSGDLYAEKGGGGRNDQAVGGRKGNGSEAGGGEWRRKRGE